MQLLEYQWLIVVSAKLPHNFYNGILVQLVHNFNPIKAYGYTSAGTASNIIYFCDFLARTRDKNTQIMLLASRRRMAR